MDEKPSLPRQEEWTVGHTWIVVCILAWGAVGAALTACAPSRAVNPVEVPVTERDMVTDLYASDGGVPPRKGARVPSKPLPGQKREPCSRGEHAIHGGCWFRFAPEDMAPPCEVGTAEHAGRCFKPIAETPRQPTSIAP